MIYVDDLVPHNVFGHLMWCHMIADSIVELNEFAVKKLHLKKEWFQAGSVPHYDITATKRELAIKYGAKTVTIQELVRVGMDKYRGWKIKAEEL